MPAAAEAVAKIETGGDPVLESVKWIAVAVAGVMAAATPLMYYVRKFNADRAADARDGAEAALYSSLGEQVSSLKRQLDELYSTHSALVLDHAKTVARLAKVEEYEATIESMKTRLAEKDSMLIEKDAEIRREREHNRKLTMEVISLKDRISTLERRILEDEARYLRVQLAAADALDAGRAREVE